MNEIIYKVSYQAENYCKLEGDSIDYSIPLYQYKNIYQFLLPGEYVKYLFFNMLFNLLVDNSVEDFLNFHFVNYTGDKSEFIRIFKLDIDEIFESFEVPWRETPVLYVDPITGRTLRDSSKIIITDVLPFFQSYNYIKYLKYKRRYNESEYWMKNKQKELLGGSLYTKTKIENYSKTRARAFCIKLMQDQGKINFYNNDKQLWRKKEMIEFIESIQEWEDQSGQTVYEEFLKINAKYDSYQSKYKKDYDFGYKLFNEIIA